MKRIVTLSILGAVLALALPAGTRATDAGDRARLRAMMNRLESTRVNVNFEGTSLEEALGYLGRFTGVNILISPKLRNAGADAVSFDLTLSEVRAKEALRILLEWSDLGIVFRHGVLQVTTKEDARGKPVLRIYAISDLTFHLQDFPGPDLQLKPSGMEFEDEPEDTREDPFEDPEFIVEIVRSNILPDSWDAEGVSIQASKKMLIVRQSPAAHAQIARLLDLLRAYK